MLINGIHGDNSHLLSSLTTSNVTLYGSQMVMQADTELENNVPYTHVQIKSSTVT